MKRTFQLADGVDVTDLSGIQEAYSVQRMPAGFHTFTINVSAENIPSVFCRLAAEVNEPGFLLFELPTHRQIEEQLRKNETDPFHRDVYYLDGLTWEEARAIFKSYEYPLTHDGEVNFGFGSHSGHDEVLVAAYKIFHLYADEPQKYRMALDALGYQQVSQLRTVWQNLSPESPGCRRALTDAEPTIWEMVEELKQKGLYLAERRED